MIRDIKIFLMASFMLLLSALWAGSAAMASYCAVSISQSQQSMLCGNGSDAGKAISFVQLGLVPPETDLPEPHDCECELSQDNHAPIDDGVKDFTLIRYAQVDGLMTPIDAKVLQVIRAGYLSRGPPQSA